MSAWYILCVCACVGVCPYVCVVTEGSLCGPMAPPVHGFMNIVLWTESPCSDAQMEGEKESQLILLSEDEALH